MANTKPTIAITAGDPNGVGYEIILKTLSDPHIHEICTPVVYGNRSHLKKYQEMLRTDEQPLAVKCEVIDCYKDDVPLQPGVATKEAGRAAYLCLESATRDLKAGKVQALVTAPINKDTIQSDEFHFSGHTEYLTEQFAPETHESLMMMVSEAMRVALVCNHTPITKVGQMVTEDRMLRKLRVLNETLRQDFRIRRPRIAVLALNPHAGDNGLIGKEEQTVIKPAIDKATENGLYVYGPYAADGFFGAQRYRQFDAVLAMYHDQGLAPFKTISMDGVNYTAGLPIVRTSPDHGTAYDKAGKNEASEESMNHAIYLAIDLLRQRATDKEINADPLQIKEREQRERPERFPLPFPKKGDFDNKQA